jgi:hypothetical protein
VLTGPVQPLMVTCMQAGRGGGGCRVLVGGAGGGGVGVFGWLWQGSRWAGCVQGVIWVVGGGRGSIDGIWVAVVQRAQSQMC